MTFFASGETTDYYYYYYYYLVLVMFLAMLYLKHMHTDHSCIETVCLSVGGLVYIVECVDIQAYCISVTVSRVQ